MRGNCGRKCVQMSILTIVVIIFLTVIHMTSYLVSEFVLCTDISTPQMASNETGSIPKHIHQIFFFITDKQLPKRFKEAQQTWISGNPGFNYTLWDSSMVERLVEEKYPELKSLYYSYSHWVQRADVARYLVLHQFGGIYSDLDISCKEPMKHLLTHAGNKGVIMYWTRPGISNDFMVARARHPFIGYLLQGLLGANRWFVIPYFTIMLSTGPSFLTGRYLNYRGKEELYVMPVANSSTYLGHMTGAAWHGIDGKIIWWSFTHFSMIVRVIIVVVCVLFITKMALKLFGLYRNRKHRQQLEIEKPLSTV